MPSKPKKKGGIWKITYKGLTVEGPKESSVLRVFTYCMKIIDPPQMVTISGIAGFPTKEFKLKGKRNAI